MSSKNYPNPRKSGEEIREWNNYQRNNTRKAWCFPFKEAFERLTNQSK